MASNGFKLVAGFAAAAFAGVSIMAGAPGAAALCGLAAGAFFGSAFFGGQRAPIGLGMAAGFGSFMAAGARAVVENVQHLPLG